MINGTSYRSLTLTVSMVFFALGVACEPPATEADFSAAMLGVLATQASAGSSGSGGPGSTVDVPGTGETEPSTGPALASGFTLISTYEDNVLPNAKVPLRFSEDLDPGTLTMQPSTGDCIGSVQISNDDFRTCLGGTIEYVSDDRYRLILNENLPEGGQVVLRLRDEITSNAGDRLGAVDRDVWVCRSGWRSFPDYQKEAGQDAIALGVAEHEGVIYVAGWGKGAFAGRDQTHWIVLRSTDDGATFETIDVWAGDLSRDAVKAYATDIAVGPDGTIYVVGVNVGPDGLDRFTVRYSSDNGRTWRFWWYRDTGGSAAWSVDVRADGAVFVGGGSKDRSTYKAYIWYSRDGWSSPAEWPGPYLSSSEVAPVVRDLEAIDSDRWLKYASAISGGGTGYLQWIRESDGWRFFLDPHANFSRRPWTDLQGVYFDGVNYLVAGSVTVDEYREWMVSEYDTGARAWRNNRDRVSRLNGVRQHFYPRKLADDGNGRLYVAGYRKQGSEATRWMVRRSANGGGSWQTLSEDRETAGHIYNLTGGAPGRMLFVGDRYLPDGSRAMAMREYGCR